MALPAQANNAHGITFDKSSVLEFAPTENIWFPGGFLPPNKFYVGRVYSAGDLVLMMAAEGDEVLDLESEIPLYPAFYAFALFCSVVVGNAPPFNPHGQISVPVIPLPEVPLPPILPPPPETVPDDDDDGGSARSGSGSRFVGSQSVYVLNFGGVPRRLNSWPSQHAARYRGAYRRKVLAG